jgi:hypothetical protein
MTFRVISARRPAGSATVHNLWAADCLGFCAHGFIHVRPNLQKLQVHTESAASQKFFDYPCSASRSYTNCGECLPVSTCAAATKLSLSHSQYFAGVMLAGAQEDGRAQQS